MENNLALILWKKEKKHWSRTVEIFGKFNNWIAKIVMGSLFTILITIAHYAFALMHTLYEIFLWVFFRKAFRRNLQRMSLTV